MSLLTTVVEIGTLIGMGYGLGIYLKDKRFSFKNNLSKGANLTKLWALKLFLFIQYFLFFGFLGIARLINLGLSFIIGIYVVVSVFFLNVGLFFKNNEHTADEKYQSLLNSFNDFSELNIQTILFLQSIPSVVVVWVLILFCFGYVKFNIEDLKDAWFAILTTNENHVKENLMPSKNEVEQFKKANKALKQDF